MKNKVLLTLSLIFLSALPAFAQQTQKPDTAKPKTTREIVLSKMRALSSSEVRDTAARDTTKRDTVAQNPIVRRPPRNQQAQTPVDFGTDSVMQQLQKLSQFESTQYRGTEANFEADSNKLVIYGKKEDKAGVTREGQTMVADSLLTFDQNTNIACGHGKPVLTGEGADAPVESKEVCYDTSRGLGVAMGARTEINEGANWVVTGNLYYKEGNVYGDHGKFTDCHLTTPHYHFAAGKVKIINNDVMVARNVTLNFGDVPVFWLPFMMQSMKQGRRTGILMPQFSINDIVRRNSSYNRRVSDVGFYWAISDFMGAKFAMDWFANNYTAAEGSFDYRFNNKFLGGGATLKRYWRSEGGREFTLSTQHSWEPNERTSLRVDGQYATSSQFIAQQSFDPNELRRTIASNGSLSRRFNWGSLSLQTSRIHYISDDKVDYKLPSVGVNLSTIPISTFATWTSSAQLSRTSTDFKKSDFDPNGVDGNINSNFNMGKLSWSQSFVAQTRRAIVNDSARNPIALSAAQTMSLQSSLSFQQRLIGTTTFTPSVSVQQDFARQDTVDSNRRYSSPMRLNGSAELRMDLFGFWPGIGPMSKIRHRVSPSFSYRFSPASSIDTTDFARKTLFGARVGKQVNQFTIGLSQTIEGKYKEDEKRQGEGADSTAAAADSVSLDPTKPTRKATARKVTILSLNTDAVAYDFVAAKENNGHGIQTTDITNSLNSDLLRGLQVSITHALFDSIKGDTKRRFDPHLSRVNASFSLNNNSWLFRMFGLGKKTDAPPQIGSKETTDTAKATGGVAPTGANGQNLGLIGNSGAMQTQAPARGPIGSWNASFNFSIERPRHEIPDLPGALQRGNQMFTTSFSFQPTHQWNVSWNTGYSFSTSKFTDHNLTFTRQLHDWDANFRFLKAQNGNFSFLFDVKLRANPDIKFDYSQRSNATGTRTF